MVKHKYQGIRHQVVSLILILLCRVGKELFYDESIN